MNVKQSYIDRLIDEILSRSEENVSNSQAVCNKW